MNFAVLFGIVAVTFATFVYLHLEAAYLYVEQARTGKGGGGFIPVLFVLLFHLMFWTVLWELSFDPSTFWGRMAAMQNLPGEILTILVRILVSVGITVGIVRTIIFFGYAEVQFDGMLHIQELGPERGSQSSSEYAS